MKREQSYQRTLKQREAIHKAGYTLVECWMHEKSSPWWDDPLPEKQNETFSHAIVYYFE